MTYAFLISLVVASVGSVVLIALWKSAQQATAAEKTQHTATQQLLIATQAALTLSERGRADEKARLEQLVTTLKKELETLETNLSHDPVDVRNRLVELLGSQTRSSADHQGAFGVVPFGGSTKV